MTEDRIVVGPPRAARGHKAKLPRALKARRARAAMDAGDRFIEAHAPKPLTLEQREKLRVMQVRQKNDNRALQVQRARDKKTAFRKARDAKAAKKQQRKQRLARNAARRAAKKATS